MRILICAHVLGKVTVKFTFLVHFKIYPSFAKHHVVSFYRLSTVLFETEDIFVRRFLSLLGQKMANARKDVLDFITNHYEECDEDFQSAMLRYRELFFSRKAATEKSKAIITIRRKAKAPAKAAPEAKRLKAAPTAAGNQTAFRREEPGRKAKTPSASVSYAAAASGSGASAPPTGKPQFERAVNASLEAEQAARKESSNGSRAKAGTSTSLPDPMEQETAPGDRRKKKPSLCFRCKEHQDLPQVAQGADWGRWQC